ncbi:hypothetical protein MBLNU230_g8616t1 [Neophaeotheca triangularis]
MPRSQFSLAAAAAAAAALLASTPSASAQTFQRLGGCPTLGCVFPPDQQDFLAGQYFDIRLEVHAPVNGSEKTDGVPDENFSLTIGKVGEEAMPATEFFGLQDPPLEKWNFTWYEDLFAEEADRASLVNVAAKAYRRVALYEPGEYEATLSYYNTTTKAYWLVRDMEEVRRTKNVLLFVGDGMTTNMITAARLIGHKQINGRYQSTMAMDKFPVIGHQMTHSLDTYITDSANSATALYSGHKSTVNALGVYADSSPDAFDDPKVESIAEIFFRIHGGHLGLVSTAFIADATPAAMTSHTRDRGEYGFVIDSMLNGVSNYSWPAWDGADVILGAGAAQFCPASEDNPNGYGFYETFRDAGYQVVQSNSELSEANSDSPLLGIFSTGNLPLWLDRNVYTENLSGNENAPDCSGADALDPPGLKDMTLKAIDTLAARAGDEGWLIMSEAASIDKQMHSLDYDRALGELLELDDTIKASLARLEELGCKDETLVLVTADHGHGFDVWGSADTQYLSAQDNDRAKRNAIGIYERSGQSQYVNSGSRLQYGDMTPGFPTNWDPRYTLAQGLGAHPDVRENYRVHKDGPRLPAIQDAEGDFGYYVNPDDAVDGFISNGTLNTGASQGVHSLTDVPVYALGPCQEIFAGSYNSIDVFFGMAECLGLSRKKVGSETEGEGHGYGKGKMGGHGGKGRKGKKMHGGE